MQSLIFRISATVLAVILAFPPLSLAQEETVDAAQARTSRILGRVHAADGKTSAAGATVKAYHLSTEEVFTSQTTDGKGNFEIAELPYGYYDLAVETPDGLFVGNQVINVPPGGKAVVNFSVVSFASAPLAAGEEPRTFPGSDATASGIAQLSEKGSGKGFWKSPKGIAVIIGSAALLLLLLANGSSGGDSASGDQVSPFN